MKANIQHIRILKFLLKNGEAESLKEIAKEYNISTRPLFKPRDDLIKDRWIAKDPESQKIFWGSVQDHPEIALFKEEFFSGALRNREDLLEKYISKDKVSMTEAYIINMELNKEVEKLFKEKISKLNKRQIKKEVEKYKSLQEKVNKNLMG